MIERRKISREKHRENNKEKIKERQAEKVGCICGSIVRKLDIRRHERSKKHITFIDNQ